VKVEPLVASSRRSATPSSSAPSSPSRRWPSSVSSRLAALAFLDVVAVTVEPSRGSVLRQLGAALAVAGLDVRQLLAGDLMLVLGSWTARR